MKTRKPILYIFTKNGKPWLIDGKRQEKTWTADGHHWLRSDGPFPYDECESRYVEFTGGGSVLDATPT